MSLNPRSKGQRGEREVCAILQMVVDKIEMTLFGEVNTKVQRNVDQARYGGYDIEGLTWAAIEVKRVEKYTKSTVDKWWAQAVRQAVNGREPILMWRANKAPWTCRVASEGGHTDFQLAFFINWFAYRHSEHVLDHRKLIKS